MHTSYMRRVAMLVAFSMGFSPIAAATKPASALPTIHKKPSGPVKYEEIAEGFMRAWGIEQAEEEASSVGAQAKLKPNFDIPELEHQEKLMRLLTLYMEAEKEQPKKDSSLMDVGVRSVIKDNDVLYGQGEDAKRSVFNEIDRTVTVFGQVALAKMVTSPTSDVAVLKARQALIKELVANPALFVEFERLVAQVKEYESEIFSFSVEDNKPTKELISNFYFGSSKALNTSPLALEASTRFGDLYTGVVMGLPVVIPALYAAAIMYGMKEVIRQAPAGAMRDGANGLMEEYMGGYPSWIFKFVTHWLDPRFFINRPEGNRVIIPADPLIGRPSLEIPTKLGLGMGVKWGLISYTVLNGLPAIATKMGYDRGVLRANALRYIQARLMGMASLVNSLKAANKVVSSSQLVAQGLATRDKIANLFNGSAEHSADFQQLVDLLQSETFQGEPSYFSLSGKVLAANTLMNKRKVEFMGAFESLGELDAVLSVAKLYKEFAQQRVNYAFVEYVDYDAPYMKLKAFWNPLVDSRIVVTNDLELGGPNKARNVILTGSNTGGKSTILKAIVLNELFAHTLTIGLGKEIAITPITYLSSSMNIADDTAAGYSLYQAEVNRVKEIIKTGAQLSGKNFGFVVVDELFRGTSPEQAEAGSYECAKQLAEMNNVMLILATHFVKQTTKLEQETGGVCKNYKVEVYKDAHGNLVRPFKLAPGVNASHVAGDILHNALQDAR